jgi:NADH:ubiquinone reductase (H+-translocating)
VEVSVGTPVTDITDQGYRLGERFVPCRTVLWAAGVAASPLGAMLGGPLDRVGRVQVNPDLTLPGHPEVFVAGDLAATSLPDGRPVPGIAPAAKQMGTHVARSMRAHLEGRSAQPFEYTDYGNLATIGRMAAVVDLRGFQLSGLLAWWFWLGAHIFFLIGFRNRVSVLVDWALAYWTYQRGARIVLGEDGSAKSPPNGVSGNPPRARGARR